MTFTNNIPQPTDKIKTSQSQLLANNAQLDTSFGIDHVTFSDTTGDTGKHKHNTFVNLTDKGLASPTTSSEEIAVYVKDDPSNDPRIFYRQKSSGDEIQVSGDTPIVAANGETFLPGRTGLKWGSISLAATGAGGTTVAYTYVTTFSLNNFVTDSYVVNLQAPGATIINVSAKSSTGFSITYISNAPFTLTWIAVGS